MVASKKSRDIAIVGMSAFQDWADARCCQNKKKYLYTDCMYSSITLKQNHTDCNLQKANAYSAIDISDSSFSTAHVHDCEHDINSKRPW